MTPADFAEIILKHLPYAPNEQQHAVVGALSRFCSPEAPQEAVFVLNGYAGTGKTSLCGALVKALEEVERQAVLLAPTGRAAKVFSAYAGHRASTIHRKIYRYPGASTGQGGYFPADNTATDTLFIVDEASMITGAESSGRNLLEDLVHYVYAQPGCRLLLIGDTAQLPPVGSDQSPAMSADVLRGFGLRVSRATLTATARQQAGSGILFNATRFRRDMRLDPIPLPQITTEGYSDISELSPEDMPEELYMAYRRDGINDTIVITRSNQRATGFNREIRASVLYLEEKLSRGELLIVAKNNYFWTKSVKEIDFVANGDSLVVAEINSTEKKYGFEFADVELSLPDSDLRFNAKIILDSLASDTAGLSQEGISKLYYGILEDPDLFSPSTPADVRLKSLSTNPYWNALQVKYGYAVTCHKAQGGQWRNVFVDMGFIPPEAMGLDFYRWLYTAVTRARSRLFILK